MLVKELRSVLDKCDPDDLVILATDAEGNDYRPLADYNETDYRWYDDELINYDTYFEDWPESWDDRGQRTLVLWPA